MGLLRFPFASRYQAASLPRFSAETLSSQLPGSTKHPDDLFIRFEPALLDGERLPGFSRDVLHSLKTRLIQGDTHWSKTDRLRLFCITLAEKPPAKSLMDAFAQVHDSLRQVESHCLDDTRLQASGLDRQQYVEQAMLSASHPKCTQLSPFKTFHNILRPPYFWNATTQAYRGATVFPFTREVLIIGTNGAMEIQGWGKRLTVPGELRPVETLPGKQIKAWRHPEILAGLPDSQWQRILVKPGQDQRSVWEVAGRFQPEAYQEELAAYSS